VKSEQIKDIEKDFTIMIIGGGLSGISTFLHLHKYSPELASKCVLIEKEKYPREKLCGGAVGGWSENILKDLEIKLNISSIMINTVECCFGDEKYSLIEENYFRMVHRKEFDYFLAKEAQKRGLIIRQEEKFLDFERKNSDLIVKTNKDTYKVKVLIGADGSLSKVRNKINKNVGNIAPTIEIFSQVNPNFDTELKEKKVVLDFTPIKEGLQGYIWHFPCIKNTKTSMNHGIVNFRIHNNISSKRHMKTIFIDELEKRNINYETVRFLGHPIRCFSKNDKISQSNVILTGDAAGIEPATGGGIHLAFSYGELAANNIIRSFKSGDYSFDNYRNDFNKSLTGRYIDKLSYLAADVYSQKINPLRGMEKIFIKSR